MSWRMRPRAAVSPVAVTLAQFAALVLTLGVGAAVLALRGLPIATMAAGVARESLATQFGLQDLGLLFTPLVLTGLAVAIPMRMGLWNIGADGQFYVGALAATGVGLSIDAPPAAALTLMAVVAALAGAAWMAIPALGRVLVQANEIVATLLLNSIAVALVQYVSTGPWRDRETAVLSASYRVPFSIPKIWGELHLGLVVAVLAAIAMALIFSYSRWGFETRVCGANPAAAHYAGIPSGRRTIEVMLLSGAIAGLGGMLEVAGTVHRLQGGLSNNYGYFGIIIAVLAHGSPFTVLVTAALMAWIVDAGTILQTYGMSVNDVLGLTGLMLFFGSIAERFVHFRTMPMVPDRSIKPST